MRSQSTPAGSDCQWTNEGELRNHAKWWHGQDWGAKFSADVSNLDFVEWHLIILFSVKMCIFSCFRLIEHLKLVVALIWTPILHASTVQTLKNRHLISPQNRFLKRLVQRQESANQSIKQQSVSFPDCSVTLWNARFYLDNSLLGSSGWSHIQNTCSGNATDGDRKITDESESFWSDRISIQIAKKITSSPPFSDDFNLSLPRCFRSQVGFYLVPFLSIPVLGDFASSHLETGRHFWTLDKTKPQRFEPDSECQVAI